jgi:hypothetical protein
MPKITFKGLKELDQKLVAMGDAYNLKSLRAVCLTAAEMIRDEAERRARALFKEKTGNLFRSFQARTSRIAEIARGYAKVDYWTATHGHLLEYGHRIVKGKGSKAHDLGKRVVGHPFFRPAVDSLRPRIRKGITAVMQAVLLDIARKTGQFTPIDARKMR